MFQAENVISAVAEVRYMCNNVRTYNWSASAVQESPCAPPPPPPPPPPPQMK